MADTVTIVLSVSGNPADPDLARWAADQAARAYRKKSVNGSATVAVAEVQSVNTNTDPLTVTVAEGDTVAVVDWAEPAAGTPDVYVVEVINTETPATVRTSVDPVTGGVAAAVFGTEAADTDFTGAAVTFTVAIDGGAAEPVTLDADYTNIAGVVAEINTALTGTPAAVYDTDKISISSPTKTNASRVVLAAYAEAGAATAGLADEDVYGAADSGFGLTDAFSSLTNDEVHTAQVFAVYTSSGLTVSSAAVEFTPAA